MNKGNSVAVHVMCSCAVGGLVQFFRAQSELNRRVGLVVVLFLKGHPGNPDLIDANCIKKFSF